jgi:hypothetical protein
MNILGGVLGAVADLGKTYLGNKAAEKQAKHEARMNTIKNDADWETKMAEASNNSLKDEFFSGVLSLPLLFIGYAVAVDDPTIINRVKEGFNTLSELPEWYQYLLFIAVSSSFGIKGADKIMNLRKK